MQATTMARTQTRGWYRTYMAMHETPAQRYARRLAQGPQREDASPCRRCGATSTTDLCVYCAIDDVATSAQKANGF